jgi:hypothetical protein
VASSASGRPPTTPFTSFTPSLTSALQRSSRSRWLRDFKTDSARAQIDSERTNRDIADIQVRERSPQVAANAEAAYWALVVSLPRSTCAAAVDLALELERTNRARVDVGQSPPLELGGGTGPKWSQRREDLIIAPHQRLQAEDLLRTLILDPKACRLLERQARSGRAQPAVCGAPDVDAAVRRALAERSDIAQARTDREQRHQHVRWRRTRRSRSSRAGHLPHQRSGRVAPAPEEASRHHRRAAEHVVRLRCSARCHADYPNVDVRLSLSYPLGHSAERANLREARIEREQGGGAGAQHRAVGRP